ncbi:hypothetical protein KEF85_04225 [Methylomonas paludis]|uniref:Carrier domain-containing protein n=1 Tax=Methylomonas paludis TaxID=1173101 RepID=A0A975RAX2_9GAMM|nr:thioesterase domain-containing protein [Methylomonas paludis]QWF71691.1 hypothetical protein KEF85_04225 [Methylomonas paludis]
MSNYTPPRNDVENQLVDIWKTLLEIDEVGIHDNFFDLGGFSLTALELTLEIKDQFNQEINLGRVYQAPTIAELAVEIFKNQQVQMYSLVPIQTQGSKPPLFSIHTISLLDLPQRLGKDQPLYFLRYGMAASAAEAKIHLPTVEELAAHYISEIRQVQPQGPYFLMGFSFGGLIAYEMAYQLAQSGQQVKFLGLLDTYLDDDKYLLPWPTLLGNIVKHFPKIIRKLWLKLQNRVKPTNEKPVFDPHDYAPAPDQYARRHYQPKIYSGIVTLIQAAQPKQFLLHRYVDPEFAWRKLLGENLRVELIPGEHYAIFTEQHIASLADKLNECLNSAHNQA